MDTTTTTAVMATAALLLAAAPGTGCDTAATCDDTCGALGEFDGDLYGAHGTMGPDGTLERYSRWPDDGTGSLTVHVPAGDHDDAIRAAMVDVVEGWNAALVEAGVDLRLVLADDGRYDGFSCDDHAAIIVDPGDQGPSSDPGYSVEPGDVVVCMHSAGYVGEQWDDLQGGNARVLRSSDCGAAITRAVISLSPEPFQDAQGAPVANHDALLRHVLAHETGHVLGLGHPRQATVGGVPLLMAPTSDYASVGEGDHLPTYGETEGLWCVYHDACADDLSPLE